MNWKPTTLLEFNSETKQWSKRRFERFHEYLEFVKSSVYWPGEFNLTNTEHWREPSLYYLKHKRYTEYHPKSKEYKEYWLLERRKCVQGLIVDNRFIPGSMYFFLNFTPVYNKLEGRETFPDLYDGQYFLSLYLELAYLEGEDAAGTKVRQRGISLFLMAVLLKEVWFGKKSMSRVIGHEEEYVLLEWNIMEGYRDWLNSQTGWYRSFLPNEILNWEQKQEVTEGIVEKKKSYKGNKTRIKGATTKKNIAKSVGGGARFIYATEAGIYPNLEKVRGYVKENLKLGSVKTGTFIAMGSVGELKDSQDLQNYCFNPKAYNIRSIKDIFSGSMDDIGFFYPSIWNHVAKDASTGEVVKCYDKHGNSDITLANYYLDLEEEKARLAGETTFKMYKSQNPRTLQDAFDQREDNPFPTHLLKKRELELISQKDITVSFERTPSGKVIHRFTHGSPINTLKVNPEADNRGAVVIYEFPVNDPPLGLYYAGVDPIHNMDTSTSRSLMSITIRIAMHERDGKLVESYPVATYTGRHKKVSETYQIVLDLIEFYNARVAVESNVKDFIEWMIRQGKGKYLMRRRELSVISEMMPNSTIRDEIGVRMEGEFKKRAIEKMIHELEEPIAESFNMETGESESIYGVSRYRDIMFLRECLRWSPKLNTDRIVSNMMAKIATDSSANRHIIKHLSHVPQPKPKLVREMTSPFRASSANPLQKKVMYGHFRK